MSARQRHVLAFVLLSCAALAHADDGAPKISGSVTGFYYAMRDESDFGVGVAAVNRDSLHIEGRYNYEARDSGSLFVGWNFSGADQITWQFTPILGVLFGDSRGVIPGFEASVAYASVDFYVEAEYVADSSHHDDSYFYAWSELGWKPVEWLRLGLVGQRTHTVHPGRDLQRGLFAQVLTGPFTFGVYAFNPDSSSRYVIGALGIAF